MIIPEKVFIAGMEVKVIIVPEFNKNKGYAGYCDYAKQTIYLAGDVSQQTKEVSLIHEILHYILFVMGEDKLRKSERFVDLLAHFIHQTNQSLLTLKGTDNGTAENQAGTWEDNTEILPGH